MEYCGTSREQRIEAALLILKQPSLDFSFISSYFGSSVTAALLFSWLEVNGLAEKTSNNTPWIFYTYKIRQYLKQELSEEELKQFQAKVNKAWQERNLSDYFVRQHTPAQNDMETHLHWLAFLTVVSVSLYFWLWGTITAWTREGMVLGFLMGALSLLVLLFFVLTKYGGSNLFLYMASCIVWGCVVIPAISLVCFIILSQMHLIPS